jgi:C4-dicarboxylate-specific signal transduction histidine kinase
MAVDKPIRRLTLRELTAHAEKSTRALMDQLHSAFQTQLSDFRDLSRPVRRRSHYPTLVAVQNSLKSLLAAGNEAQSLANALHEQLEEIVDRAKREKINRV